MDNQITTKQLAIIGIFWVVWGHFENCLDMLIFRDNKNWIKKDLKKKKDKLLVEKAKKENNIRVLDSVFWKVDLGKKLDKVNRLINDKKTKTKLKDIRRSWGPIEFRNIAGHQPPTVSIMGAMHNNKCPGYERYTKPISDRKNKNRRYEKVVKVEGKNVEVFNLYTMEDILSFAKELLSFTHTVGYRPKHKINFKNLCVNPL